MRRRSVSTTVLLRLLSLTGALLASCLPAAEWLLFTSFRGNGEDGLHLAISTNGYSWDALRGDRSFLRPTVGGKLMRDPCVARGPEGVFHMVWTSGWTADTGKVIGYSSSTNCVDWTPQKAIPLMQDEPQARNIWAPEIFYDQRQRRWLIFWSSTVRRKFTDTADTGDDGYNHRFYCAWTKDFDAVSESRLFYDPGFNSIDATLMQDAGRFYLFFKDERKQPLKKNLRYATATRPEGPFGEPSSPFTGDWVEGPSAIKLGDYYLVYFDHYAPPHYYGAVRSKDLKVWEDCSKEMKFPLGQRHGTVLRIPEKLALELLGLL